MRSTPLKLHREFPKYTPSGLIIGNITTLYGKLLILDISFIKESQRNDPTVSLGCYLAKKTIDSLFICHLKYKIKYIGFKCLSGLSET